MNIRNANIEHKWSTYRLNNDKENMANKRCNPNEMDIQKQKKTMYSLLTPQV